MPLSKSAGKRGDLVIRFEIIFPRYITEQKKAKIRNLLANPEKDSA
jgi:DnaJ-class molecular chaperone